MKVMILAAGEGTRLRPFTLELPKPAIPFLGVPMVNYGIHLIRNLPLTGLVVNHHHLGTEIRKLFEREFQEKYQIHFSDETQSLMDSGGGVHQALSFLKSHENFLVMNGDELIFPQYEDSMIEAFDHHIKTGNLATLCVKKHPGVGTDFGGAWADSSGNVVKFSKTAVPELVGWHYIGVLFLSTRIEDYFNSEMKPENLLYDTLTRAIEAGEKVGTFEIECEWFESGRVSDFLESTEACLQELSATPRKPWTQGLYDFLKTQNRQPCLVESDNFGLRKKLDMLWSELHST